MPDHEALHGYVPKAARPTEGSNIRRPELRASQVLVSHLRFRKTDPHRSSKSPVGDSCGELDAGNRAHLLDYLLGLDQRGRNVRFQCGASDSFITRYYLGINWGRHVAIVWRQSGLVIGLAELASLAESWRQPELAISIGLCGNPDYVRHRLLQAACVTARERGAGELIIWFGSEEEWVPRLARKCGAVIDWVRQCATIPLHDIEHAGFCQEDWGEW